MADATRIINAWPSSIEQLALARFIEAGQFDRHIRQMRGIDPAAARPADRHARGARPIAAGGHALVRLPPGGPAELELVTKAAPARPRA